MKHEQNGKKINKEKEILELKNIISNLKIDWRVQHRFDEAGKVICELEHKSFEIIQSEGKKE